MPNEIKKMNSSTHSCSSDTLRPRLASLLPADVHEDLKHLPEVPEAQSEDAGELEEKPEEQEAKPRAETMQKSSTTPLEKWSRNFGNSSRNPK